MLSFYLKESLDITKIKDPEHSKESEVDFSGNLGRGVLLLSILFVIVYAILLVKFRRYIGAFEASLTPMIIKLPSSPNLSKKALYSTFAMLSSGNIFASVNVK